MTSRLEERTDFRLGAGQRKAKAVVTASAWIVLQPRGPRALRLVEVVSCMG